MDLQREDHLDGESAAVGHAEGEEDQEARQRALARAATATVAVISDTHLPRGGRRLPDRCVELCRAADLILHAGDFVSAEFWRELRAFGPPVEAVYGNMDDVQLKATLPLERVVEVEGARIGMLHIPGPAAGRAARLRARFPDCDAIVYGHTHVPEASRDGGVWILNPGSPTERRRAPARAMPLLHIDAGALEPKPIELT